VKSARVILRAGAGIRSMVNHVVLRVDLAASSEDVIAQLFIGHPFWSRRAQWEGLGGQPRMGEVKARSD